MKVFIVLAAVAVSCVSAGHLGGYGGAAAVGGAAYASSGTSSQFRSEDNYGNYQFGYDESHATGSTGRREERQGHVVRGSYNLGDADGRQRTVNYVADETGFRATIHTNEPGVDSARDPADVLLNKEGHGYAAAAPAPVALPIAAPIAAPAYAPLAAPAPLAAAVAPIVRAAPVYGATKSYGAPAPLALAAPAPVYTEAHAPVYEAPTPRAFSYSFGASHPAMSYAAPAPVYAQAPIAAPAPVYAQAAPIAAPVYQQGLKY